MHNKALSVIAVRVSNPDRFTTRARIKQPFGI
jgi:hypothetical protein